MRMRNVYICFFRRTSKDCDKKESVYCRITVDGLRAEFSTGVKIQNRLWDQSSQLIKGTSLDALIGNRVFIDLRNQINEIAQTLTKRGIVITAKIIHQELDGGNKVEHPTTLLASYKKEIERKQSQIGSNYTKSSLDKINQSYKGLEFFVTKIIGKKDLHFADVDYKFIKSFENWAYTEGMFHGRSKKRWKTNYFIGEISIIKRLVEDAFKMGIIPSSPFVGYSPKREPAVFKFLSQTEVELIESVVFNESQKHLEETRDIFIFCCYTGLAFADVYGLSKDALVQNEDFGLCINKNRQKSNVEIFVPVLDKPRNIIAKYESIFSEAQNILPLIPYHKYREALKEIEVIAQIKKPIKSHVARHTAATYFLNNNIPEEVTCRALGLSSVTVLRSTYGKFLNKTVAKHFMGLKNNITA